jgi:glucokinase
MSVHEPGPAETALVAADGDDLDQMRQEIEANPVARAADEDVLIRKRLLAALIRARGRLSQSTVAEAMGTTQSAVSDIEHGRVDPRLSTLQRYARAVEKRIVTNLVSTDSGEDPAESASDETIERGSRSMKARRSEPGNASKGRDSAANAVAQRAAPRRGAASDGEERYAIGIELQPYRLNAVLVRSTGDQIAERRHAIDDMRISTVVGAAAAVAEELMATASIPASLPGHRVALGLQLGGPVNTLTGTVHYYSKSPPTAPNSRSGFKWKDQPLGPLLRDATGLETFVLNDADALAEKEQWEGVGLRTRDFAVMLLSEGIGGSIVRGGTIFDGPVEIGNFIIHTDTVRTSTAGVLGALETTAGTTAIIDEVHEKTKLTVDNIDGAAAVADKDGRAVEAFKAAGVAMACGMGYMIGFSGVSDLVLYAPAVMIEKGRPAADAFLEEVLQFKDHVAFDAYKKCQLVLRPMNEQDGAHGAALTVLRRYFNITPVGLLDLVGATT